MKSANIAVISSMLLAFNIPVVLSAGPYAGAVGTSTTTAIYKDSEEFVEWASSVVEYDAGDNVSSSWQTLSNALGEAQGTSYNILCLGDGGSVILTFDEAICDGDGYDFAVFENAFNNTYLELAYVEVSSDGVHWVRFPNVSLTESAVGAYGSVDCTNIDGLAGKYKQGYGTPFDLSDLEGVDGSEYLDFDNIVYVKIVDIVGDGTYYDSEGNVIYDPYATSGSSNGFDLDAVGVIHCVPEPASIAFFAGIAALGFVLRRRKA